MINHLKLFVFRFVDCVN